MTNTKAVNKLVNKTTKKLFLAVKVAGVTSSSDSSVPLLRKGNIYKTT